MSGIEKFPLRIPEQWSAQWFRQFVAEVLAKLDTRNSIGEGVVVSSDGNSVATLSVTASVASAIAAHDALVTAHDPALDAHRAETDPHPDLIDDLANATTVALTDEVLVSQGGTNRAATVEQMRDTVFGDDWTDLVIEGVGINPPGTASDPTRNTTTGLLEFSASQDNVLTGCWQMPHGWAGAYDATKAIVVPHLHVRCLTSTSAPNNVSRWKFEYDVASVNGTFANAYASFTTLATVSLTNPAATAKAALVSFGDLDLTGKGASALIHFRISRLANSDAADNDTSVIALYSMDLHYQVRKAGSETAIPP